MNILISGFPSLLMGVATLGWLHQVRQSRHASDRADLVLACGLLNVAAFIFWNALSGPGAAVHAWMLHAGAAVALNFLLTLAQSLNDRHLLLRPVAPVGYALAAGLTALWTLPSQAI